jgi:putative nucleotidyltransferase with HDIG domain
MAADERYRHDIGSPVGLLITLTAAAASCALALAAPLAVHELTAHPARSIQFLLLTLALQLTAVPVHGRGHISVSAIGVLATAIVLGPGAAMTFSVLAAFTQWIYVRGAPHRALFDASQFVLTACVGAYVFRLGSELLPGGGGTFVAAIAAALVYSTVNNFFVCFAIGLSESQSIRRVWNDRFRWGRFHYLAFGPLAYASAAAYEAIGILGLVAFTLPPVLVLLSMRQYLERTRAAVDEVRAANEELTRVNMQLAERNRDLRDLFEFAGGLASHSHDRGQLVAFAESWLGQTSGGTARIRVGVGSGGTALVAGGKQVGSLSLLHGDAFDDDRWHRLRDALVPQLATAIESAALVDQVRRTHVATIAALSRTIEAKDASTGDHTERVAAVSVALARRLGYEGQDLDAIEMGALLHDVGKIGVPETILQKPGPLDDEEWQVMRRHPLLSEYILAEANLPPIVREIARWSHERVDGRGYPDGLDGDEIPLPARIVLVADALDAITSDRPYREGRPLEAAMGELRANAGAQFCPTVIEALEAIYLEEPHVLTGGRLQSVTGGSGRRGREQAQPFEAVADAGDLRVARFNER